VCDFDDFIDLSIVMYFSVINNIKKDELSLISMNFVVKLSIEEKVLLDLDNHDDLGSVAL